MHIWHPPLWIRDNAERLGANELARIRRNAHLTDLELHLPVYKRLIWAGHRWAEEFAHLSEPEVYSLLSGRISMFSQLRIALLQADVHIGQRANVRSAA